MALSRHVKNSLVGKIVEPAMNGGVSMRIGVVSAVNAGPPVTVDVAIGGAGGDTWAGVRRLVSYSPSVLDRVVVLVQQPGNGQTGGWAIVIGEST